MMLRLLTRFLASPAPPRARPKPSRLRTHENLVQRRPDPAHCEACGMLLGAIALRRGACPRCRARFTPERAKSKR
jgi:hypothetical protein